MSTQTIDSLNAKVEELEGQLSWLRRMADARLTRANEWQAQAQAASAKAARLEFAKMFVLADGAIIAQQSSDGLWYVTRCRDVAHFALTEGKVWTRFDPRRGPGVGSAFLTADAAFEAEEVARG